MLLLLDPELLLLLLPELLLELELLSPLLPELLLEPELLSPLDAELLDVELLESLLLPLDDPELDAVSDDELPPVPDACASNSTLMTPLLTWPEELEPEEPEALVVVFAAVESAEEIAVSVVEVLLAVSALSKAKRALAVAEELALETDICCS